MKIQTADLLGVKLQAWNLSALHQEIENVIKQKRHALALHVNIYGLNLAYMNIWMRDFINSAEIVFCDGAGVILGAKILGYIIPIRITYADWTWQLAEFAELRGYSFFFLGGRPGIAELATARLIQRFPRLRITGSHHGFFDKTLGGKANDEVIKKINEQKPNILIVAFGMPLQERWLMENWDRIDADIALTGGAVFDYISGELRRAPKWMSNNGLEWLGRLLIEPRRLWKRYLIGIPQFYWRILLQKFGLLRI